MPVAALPYEVRHSGIHGNGLFASRSLTQGTKIIQYVGERIDKEESARRAERMDIEGASRGAGRVYIFELDEDWDIDGNVDWNPARFANHRCDGNCESIQEDGAIWLCARRDIASGEELTYDYGYDLEHYAEHPCRCGSPGCVGFIVGRQHHWRIRRLVRTLARRQAEQAKETPCAC